MVQQLLEKRQLSIVSKTKDPDSYPSGYPDTGPDPPVPDQKKPIQLTENLRIQIKSRRYILYG